MGAFNVTMRVTLEEGHESFEVTTDQRDFYRWEKMGNVVNDKAKQVEMTRFLAWHAGSRQGLTTLAWKEFDKVLIDSEDIGSEAEPDPTPPTR